MSNSTYGNPQKTEVKYLHIESFVSNQYVSHSRIATKVRAVDQSQESRPESQVRFAT